MNARSVLVVVAALMVLVARSARADDVHYYALRDGRIVVDDRQELQTPVECKQTFALVVTGRYLFVACGAEGAATYSLSEPLHPVMTGRIETPCETLTSQGVC